MITATLLWFASVCIVGGLLLYPFFPWPLSLVTVEVFGVMFLCLAIINEIQVTESKDDDSDKFVRNKNGEKK